MGELRRLLRTEDPVLAWGPNSSALTRGGACSLTGEGQGEDARVPGVGSAHRLRGRGLPTAAARHQRAQGAVERARPCLQGLQEMRAASAPTRRSLTSDEWALLRTHPLTKPLKVCVSCCLELSASTLCREV
jgi:hypothetical protein